MEYHNQRTGVEWYMEGFKEPQHYRIKTVPRYDLSTMRVDIRELAKDVLEKG